MDKDGSIQPLNLVSYFNPTDLTYEVNFEWFYPVALK
jgi:hypothetical protein